MQYLDFQLRFAPLNRVIYDFQTQCWYNVSVESWWKLEGGKKASNDSDEEIKKGNSNMCGQEILNILSNAANDVKLFGVFTKIQDSSIHVAAFRRNRTKTEWLIFDPLVKKPLSVSDEKKFNAWSRQFADMEVFILEKELQKAK